MVTVELIKNDEQHAKSMKRIQEIFQAKEGTPEFEELEILVTLVAKYEEEHYPVALPDPIEAIKESMFHHGLKDKDLMPAIGSKSGVSHILNRKRPLTVGMIRNLSERLNISVEVLIQPYELNTKQENESA